MITQGEARSAYRARNDAGFGFSPCDLDRDDATIEIAIALAWMRTQGAPDGV